MAKKSKTMSLKWNYKGEALLNRLGFDKNTEKFFARTVLQYATPYTPYKPLDSKPFESHIRGGAKISAYTSGAKITYPDIPYAAYQYNADDSSWVRTTPGTRSGWLEYAWLVHRTEIVGKVGAYRRWHSK